MGVEGDSRELNYVLRHTSCRCNKEFLNASLISGTTLGNRINGGQVGSKKQGDLTQNEPLSVTFEPKH